MKIKLEEKPHLLEKEVTISFPKKDQEVERILTALQLFNRDIIGKKDNDHVVIKLMDILYFESVDDKVFAYTEKDAFTVKERLYVLEEWTSAYRFARVSVSMIVNLAYITTFKSTINGRMEARLKNNEMIEINRTYVPILRKYLGG